MKIAFFIPFSGIIGGAERRLLRAFDSIDPKYVQVFVLVKYTHRNLNGEIIKKYANKNVKYLYFKRNYEIIKHIFECKYDWICYTDCFFRTLPLIISSIKSKINRNAKLMMCNVTVSSARLNFDSFIKKKMYRFIAQNSTVLDCLYPSCTKLLKQTFPKQKVYQTPIPFTETQLFYPKNKNNTIVFSSRLINGKNADLFIKGIALAATAIKKNGYHCYICGAGKQLNMLKKLSENKGCSDFLEFTNFIDMESILPYAKIFCSLQQDENYPSQSLLEAISSGCYCISTNVGDTNIIVKEEFGTLINIDEYELADSLIKAVNFKKSNWNKISLSAREFAMLNFRKDRAVTYYQNIFKKNNKI